MPATDTLTWDAAVPFRPSVDDLGGTGKENATRRPDPVTMLTAEELNQYNQQLAAFGRIAPLAILTLDFIAGAPTVTDVKAPGSLVAIGSFTCVDNGNGDTTIWWTATTVLPPTTGAPTVSQADDTEIDRVRAFYTTVSSNPAVNVKTKLGATGTDAKVVIQLF